MADPDIQIRGVGGGHRHSEIRGMPGQFGLKIRGGGSATANDLKTINFIISFHPLLEMSHVS